MGLRAVGAAFAQVTSHFAISLIANLTAAVLSIPLVLLIGIGGYVTRSFGLLPLSIALLIGVLPNPVMAGVQAVARDLAHRETIYLSDQIDGLRRYWRIALKAWLFSVPITALIILNLAFYANAQFPLSSILALIWLFVLFTWLEAHLYVFPLLIEQEVKRILLVYRNAVLMAVSRPLFTLMVVLLWLALLLLCSATGLIAVIGLALSASIQQNAAARLLPTFELPSAAE